MSDADKQSSDEQDAGPKVQTSNRLTVTFGLIILAILFIAVGGWLYQSKIAGAVIAQGQIAVSGKPKTVQHLDGGIVAQIAIENGNKVEKGQLLIKLDGTLLEASRNIYQSRLLENVVHRSRLVAERDGQKQITWEETTLDLFELTTTQSIRDGQKNIFEARQNTRQGQIDQLKEKVKQYRNQQTGITALVASKNTQLGFLDEELSGVRSLSKQGLTSKSQLMSLERQREEIIGQIAEENAEFAGMENAISEAEIQVLLINREFQQNVLTELRDVDQEINEIIQELYSTMEQLRRIEIRAPVSGIVHELNVFTIGGVISAANPVLQIIPQDQAFEIEANVEPQFIDEVYPNQPATLRFSAFNQRSTPELNGSIKSISADVVIDEVSGFPFYTINLLVPDHELQRLKGNTLIPGMPVEVFIKTQERSALSYLTKPLMDQINKAFREE